MQTHATTAPEIATSCLSAVAYPLLIAAALAGYALLVSAGAGVSTAGIAPVLAAALAVAALEMYLPYRPAWRPARPEVGTDVWFMATVQGLLPRLLAFAVVLMLSSSGWPGSGLTSIWPHHWHPALQTLMVLLGADFLSYWLHRAMHRVPALWRLHAVHHSPERLYWLNVGRFHPVEKALQFLASIAPFLALGVEPVILGGYFVFYAVNGFVQHSNARLRFGPLNWLVSSPELHRWHHSVQVPESDRNFGNNLIVWDWLFGTRFLPRGRAVRTLGLRRPYPRSFPGLLAAPFRGLRRALRRLVVRAGMAAIAITDGRRLERAAREPAARQQRALRRVMHANRASRFGVRHGFDRIDSHAALQAAVPVQDYASLQSYIDEQRSTGRPALTRTRPSRFLQTSGTAGVPKLIPVGRAGQRRWRVHQRLSLLAQYRCCPPAFEGKPLIIVGAGEEGHLDDGTPVGSMSGALYEHLPGIVRRRAVPPPEVASIGDYTLRYRAILRLALAEPDITLAASPNPSTFLRLTELFQAERLDLIEDIAGGRWRGLPDLDPATRRAVAARLRADPARAAALEAAGPEPGLGGLWPRLRLVATWTGGSCGIALEALRRGLRPDTDVFDLGYAATEVLGTLPLGDGDGLPDLDHVFYEFVERVDWERGNPEYLGVAQLQAERDYYVIVTTPDGLYRYFMNDLVRVTGFQHSAPRLRFVRKGRGVTNITGEKLSEEQVLAAVKGAEKALNFAARFWVVLADEHAAAYRLLIEPAAGGRPAGVAGAVDDSLCCLNMEYAAKRHSGRLGSLAVDWLLPGTGEAYKMQALAGGQRETQFKPQVLQYARACRFPFERYVAGRDAQAVRP